MSLKSTYIVLCVIGFLLPYSQFIPWLVEHGLNIHLFFDQLFSNRISAFFAVDLLVSAAVLITLIYGDHSHRGVSKKWVPIIALFTVGVSLAFPLFLYMRELKLEERRMT